MFPIVFSCCFSIVTFDVFDLSMLFMTFILEEYKIIIFYIIPQFWFMFLHCYSEIIHFILQYMSVHHIRNHMMSVCLTAVDAKFDNLRWYLTLLDLLFLSYEAVF